MRILLFLIESGLDMEIYTLVIECIFGAYMYVSNSLLKQWSQLLNIVVSDRYKYCRNCGDFILCIVPLVGYPSSGHLFHLVFTLYPLPIHVFVKFCETVYYTKFPEQ